ncbi:MAG: SGNH/GDSL hydrolase family protein [Burkholderiaceae bacterium]|nr:SGNH/GDSL hydrolase family protein [Burkholderiaceae bacterium]
MSAPERLSARAKRVLAAALVIVAIVILMGGAEIAVRVRQAWKHGTSLTLDQMYAIDPVTKLRIPKAGGDFGRIRIDSRGFRNPELVDPEPAGTVRVAFLGASTTFCAEVSSNEATWPHLVTEALRRRFPDTRIDYVNAGVPGYTVESSLVNLKQRVAPLRPDVIVIYHATNDLSGEIRALAGSRGVDIAPPEASWIARRSLLWLLVSKNLTVLAAQRRAQSSDARYIPIDQGHLGSAFKNRLGSLVEAAKGTGAEVAVVTFTTQMRRDQEQEARNRAMQSAVLYSPGVSFDGLIDSFARYNEIIREVATEKKVILVGDEDAVPGDSDHFVDSVHFTDAGSRAQAARVAGALADHSSIVNRLDQLKVQSAH